MDDLSTRVREELHRAVDHVEVSPELWEEIRRRHRREPRKRMFELATSLAVLVVAAAVLFPVARGLVERSASPAGDDPFGEVVTTGSMPTLEGDELLPMTGATGPVEVLATGELDGQEWMFTAFRRADGELFFGFPQPDPGMLGGDWWPGGTENPLASPDEPSIVMMDVHVGSEVPRLLVGVVDEAATQARVELVSGEVRKFDTVGQDANFGVNFVVVPVSAGVEVNGALVTAHDASGDELGGAIVNELGATPAPTPAPDGPLGPATGPERTVASGEFEGEPWEMFARKYAEGICYEFRYGRPIRATRGSCDPYEGMPMAGAVSVVVEGGPNLPTAVFGVVREEAAVVRVEFPDGTVHDVRPAGRELDFPVAFYALAVPPAGAPSVDVRAYDDAGNELGPPEEPLGPESPGKETPTPEPPTPGSSPLGLETATGPVVTLDSGEVDGIPWEFVAHEWAEGICFGFPEGGGAFCDPSTSESPVGIGVLTDSGEGLSLVYGAMPVDTEVIRIRLPDGREFDLPPLGQEEFGVSFFVMALPPGTPVDGVRAEADPRGAGSEPPATTTTTPNG